VKILLTCKQFPHSKVIGGPIIIYNRLKHLSRRHLVSLAAFAHEEEKEYLPSVKPFCHDLQLVPYPRERSLLKIAWDFFASPVPPYFRQAYDSPGMSRVIGKMIQKDRYDFVIAEYSVMGQFIHNNSALPPVRRIISVHESYYLARKKAFRHHKLGLEKLREAVNLKGLKKYEFDMYRQADKVLTLTPEGKEELLAVCPELDISIVPHGVDVDYFAFSDLRDAEESIVFVGNYLHYPNVDAVLYFHREMWPLLKNLLPKIKFYIVGQAPPADIQRLAQDESIVVTGRVDDVRPYLKKGRVFICPVDLGGGFRGKILEAMAMGLPVVSTSLGAEGIPIQDGENIIIGDDPQRFAQGVVELMKNEVLFRRIAKKARQLMEEKYAWGKGVEVMERILEEMMSKKPSNY
jgi:glycosyltransferase involved in cell wall biosynthesis